MGFIIKLKYSFANRKRISIKFNSLEFNSLNSFKEIYSNVYEKIRKDLNSLFGKLNVKKNDNIFLHLNSGGLINYRNKKKVSKFFLIKL